MEHPAVHTDLLSCCIFGKYLIMRRMSSFRRGLGAGEDEFYDKQSTHLPRSSFFLPNQHWSCGYLYILILYNHYYYGAWRTAAAFGSPAMLLSSRFSPNQIARTGKCPCFPVNG